MNNYIDDIYESWIEEVSRMPLRTSSPPRTGNIARALEINNQLVTNLYSIRRHLEMQDSLDIPHLPRLPAFQINDFFGMMQGMFEAMIADSNVSTMEDVKVVMPEEDFMKLSCTEIQEDSEKKECNICIETYTKGDFVIELPCKHIFHKHCIRKWLCTEKINCPVCRRDMRDFITTTANKE
jgi:hypothetical protein